MATSRRSPTVLVLASAGVTSDAGIKGDGR
jgi:hypothetical protein